MTVQLLQRQNLLSTEDFLRRKQGHIVPVKNVNYERSIKYIIMCYYANCCNLKYDLDKTHLCVEDKLLFYL